MDASGNSDIKILSTDLFGNGAGGTAVGVVLNGSAQVQILGGLLQISAVQSLQAALVNSANARLTLRGATLLSSVSGTAGCTGWGINGFGVVTIDQSSVAVFASAPAPCTTIGVLSQGAGALVTVRSSSITSTTTALFSSSTTPLRVAASQLAAATPSSGTSLVCIGSYRTDFTAVTAGCD